MPSVPPCKHLGDEAPPGARTSRAKSMRQFGQARRSSGDRSSCGRWRWRPCRTCTTSAGPPSIAFRRVRRILVEEVHHSEVDAGDGVDIQEIDADHPALALRRAHLRRRDLRPAARRRAEVDHALAGLQQMILVVDLDELERGARAIALALGPRDIGIVELALEPARLGDGAFLARSSPAASAIGRPSRPDLRLPPLDRNGIASRVPDPTTPSSLINSIRMPSRKPRSAIAQPRARERRGGSLPGSRSPPARGRPAPSRYRDAQRVPRRTCRAARSITSSTSASCIQRPSTWRRS